MEEIIEVVDESLQDHCEFLEHFEKDAVATINATTRILNKMVTLAQNMPPDEQCPPAVLKILQLIEEMRQHLPTLEAIPSDLASMKAEINTIQDSTRYLNVLLHDDKVEMQQT